MIEEITYKALGKFQVREEPLQIPPHKCCGCGRYSSGDPNEPLQFIDMGFDLEFHGEIFICVQGCFREIMNQLGVLTREQTLKIEAKLEKLTEDNKSLSKENKEYKDAVGAITRAVDSGLRRDYSLFAARKEDEPVVPPRTDQKPIGGKKGPIKQTNERGSTDVSNNEGDELLGDI